MPGSSLIDALTRYRISEEKERNLRFYPGVCRRIRTCTIPPFFKALKEHLSSTGIFCCVCDFVRCS